MTTRAEPTFLLKERKDRIDRVVSQRTRTLTLVLESLCDPQNVNAVLRTCEAFGIQEVHVVEGPMKPYHRSKKVSQNADKWLDLVRWQDAGECLRSLKARGFRVYAAHLGGASGRLDQLDFKGKVALVLGNENRGVSRAALALADARYEIPMLGFVRSFNVSVAAAVSLAKAVETRERVRGRHGDLAPEEAAVLRERFYILAVKQRVRIAKAEAVRERSESRRAFREAKALRRP